MTEALDLELTLYPNPILRKRADTVESFDEELARIVKAMYELMFSSSGVGLAAPQVGLRKRILILNDEGDPDKPDLNLTLINPTITGFGGDKLAFDEGCLSFPSIYAEIQRPDRCTVEAYDVEGKPIREEFSGFRSRVIQHENDHLEGVLLVDRMSPADKLRNKAALEELVDRYKAARS